MTQTPTTTAKATAPKAGARPPKAEDPKVKAQKMSEARNAAQSRLNEKHRRELNELITEEAKKRGITWKPKPTAEEKAEAEAKALLEQFPHLRERLLGGGEDPAEGQPAKDAPHLTDPGF